MPCDSRKTIEVELKACNKVLMFDALTELKLRPLKLTNSTVIEFGNGEFIDCATGKATLGTFRSVNEIRQAYSRAVIRHTADRNRWKVKKGRNQNELIIQKT